MNALLQSEFCGRLCLALAHSLWQAGAVAAVVGAIACVLRRRSASVRYNVYLAGLLLSAAVFPVTLVWLAPTNSEIAVDVDEPAAAADWNQPAPVVSGGAPIESPMVEPSTSLAVPEVASPVAPHASPVLPRFVPWIAAAYLTGVCAMAMRLALGMWSASCLSRRATPAAEMLQARLAQLARQWKLRIVPQLAVSAEVVVPKVVGILRPVILLPLSATTGLAPDQLDMILAHELAHVRRHDLWVNLLQRVAETVLFFNPAIWYLSRRLTTLREFTCDELVCKSTDAPTTRYAAALVRVAELSRPRAAAEIAAVAATGKSPSELRRRVARLVGEPLREPVRLTPGGAIVLVAVMAVVLGSQLVGQTTAADADSREDQRATSDENDAQKFSFGGHAEPLAIGTHQQEPQQWWKPDGTPLTSVPFHVQGGKVYPQEREKARELVFRVRGLPEGASIRKEVKLTGSSAGGEVAFGEEIPAEYKSYVFALPVDQRTFQLRVGVAAGEWQRVTEKNGPSGPLATGTAGSRNIVFSEAFAKDDATIVVVSHNMEDLDTRVIAIDRANKHHRARRISHSRVGDVNQVTWTFPNLTPADIDRFELQSREFEWVEFNDLPVHPDEEKPAVEFGEDRETSETKLSAEPDEPASAETRAREGHGTISGKIVLEDGSPATSSGWLYSDSSREGNSTLKTESKSTDQFSIEVRSGVVWLRYFATGFAPAWVGPLQLHDGETIDDVELVLKPGFSTPLLVTDEQSQPIAEAIVVAHLVINDNMIGPVVEMKTDRQGELLLENLADTPYDFTVRKAGYEPLRVRSMDLQPDQPIELEMTASAPAIGVVLNADGTAEKGASVYINFETEQGGTNYSSSEYGYKAATTDAEGRFTLDQLARSSRYLVVLETSDQRRAVTSQVQAGHEDLVFTIPQRRDLRIRVLGDIEQLPKRDGKPFVQVQQQVELRSDQGGTTSNLIGKYVYVPLTPTEEGGEAVYRGLAVDLETGKTAGPLKITVGDVTREMEPSEQESEVVIELPGNAGAPDDPAAEPDEPASPAPATESDPLLELQIDEVMKGDPMISMLQQQIMSLEYYIMQLQSDSKRSNSPQIKQYQKQKAAMEQQVAQYRQEMKQQIEKQYPFSVHGRVTDRDGKPMEDVIIRAATGVGTLLGGASTKTDADGRYTLRFGPGMAMKRAPEHAPLGVGVQAAVISARKPGWYEVNLNRQGDLLMSDQQWETLKREDLWGKKSIDSVVFPNESREVNFALAPAIVIKGQLVGDATREIANRYLTLTGEELPPAQSVFTSATTDKDGKFQMDGIPPEKPWRFQMRIDGTRGEVLSEPFTIAEPGVYRCVVSLDTERREDGSVVLKLRQEAAKMP